MFVCAEYILTKVRVSLPLVLPDCEEIRYGILLTNIQSHRSQYVRVEGLWEVLVEEYPYSLEQELTVGLESLGETFLKVTR